jgi:GntR family transcriptional repressor for pyruvate dehydrogenase complex
VSAPFAVLSPKLSQLRVGARLSEQLAEVLGEEIRAGRLAPGQRLPTEAALVERFKVSRTVVREALSGLKTSGLLDSRQGAGVFVSQKPAFSSLKFDPRHASSMAAVIQMAEVRRALESEAAELAAQRRTRAQLKAIKSALTGIDKAVREGRDGTAEDVAFHRAIAEASGNVFLMDTLAYLGQYLYEATRVTRANESHDSAMTQEVRNEHAAVLVAIDAGDPVAARAAATDHMENAIRRIAGAKAKFWAQEGDALASPLVSSRKRGA